MIDVFSGEDADLGTWRLLAMAAPRLLSNYTHSLLELYIDKMNELVF